MVFGVVKSVTAVAISFAAADLEFAEQIGEMMSKSHTLMIVTRSVRKQTR
ncbi:hypothetical protein B0O99DRAFT_726283 [Bisporella sp. PMI_857]|nr:hypothetical protein B0O99DRAFT_726283 [Bisporella sp. PMI_857]